MSEQEDKLMELEKRVNGFEGILKEIRDELKSQNGKSQNGERIQTVISTKESKLTSTQKAKIQDIMEDFDFQKVHDVMEKLDWKWAMSKNGVPTIDEMKHEAKRLLIDACIERTCVSTGGFRAVYEECSQGDPDPYIGLEFIVEDCEGFVDDEDDDGDDDVEDKAPWARWGASE